MVTFIGTMVYWNLYPAWLALALLVVPWPLRCCQRIRANVMDSVLSMKIIGSIPFMFAIISISVLTFGYTNYELKAIYQQQLYGGGNNHHVRSYERKLKLERNWWIALFSSVCWLCVYVLNERTRELDKLRAQLKNK